MCGICGFAATTTDPSSAAALRRMTEALAHRGPDGEGIRRFPQAGLGSRRLSIIDLPGGNQPIGNETGTIWMVFNGEIVNYPELRDKLLRHGHRLATRSDTEVIVHLYEEKGIDAVADLRGMFAFALWDDTRRALVLARDRLGIKPLYYAGQDGTLYFSSEIRSLRRALPWAPQLSLRSVDDYLALGYVPGPETIFEGIHQLPPASVLHWEDGTLRLRRYWTHQYDGADRMSAAQAVGELRARLEDGVRSWMISDVPVGVFLSGGVDSSAVTSLMCRVSPGKVKTFSIGFTHPRFDELRYARAVASRLGTDHEELVVDVDQTALIPKVVWHLDGPFADDSALPTFLVSGLAARSVKVVLSGDGGDELFGGYGWTYRDQYRRWYQHVPGRVRRTVEKLVLNGGGADPRRGWIPALRRALTDASTPMEHGYLRRVSVARAFRTQLYASDFTLALDGYDGASRVGAAMKAAAVKDERERMLSADQMLYLPDDILFKVDRMSMAHSLEARPPLLDHHLVEFADGLPFDLKVRGFTSKYLLKQAIRDLVPPIVLAQRKQGFSMPVGDWLRGPLAKPARNLLLNSHISRRPKLWNDGFISWMLDAHQRGTHDFGRRLWSLLIFETWSRLHLDGAASAPPSSLHDL